jgi:hypothetical protein
MLDLIFDPSRRDEYRRYEAEADRLAAYLLVPPFLRAACPSARYPTPGHLARSLGIPPCVVTRAFVHGAYRPREIVSYLTSLIGCPYFVPEAIAVAA